MFKMKKRYLSVILIMITFVIGIFGTTSLVSNTLAYDSYDWEYDDGIYYLSRVLLYGYTIGEGWSLIDTIDSSYYMVCFVAEGGFFDADAWEYDGSSHGGQGGVLLALDSNGGSSDPGMALTGPNDLLWNPCGLDCYALMCSSGDTCEWSANGIWPAALDANKDGHVTLYLYAWVRASLYEYESNDPIKHIAGTFRDGPETMNNKAAIPIFDF